MLCTVIMVNLRTTGVLLCMYPVSHGTPLHTSVVDLLLASIIILCHCRRKRSIWTTCAGTWCIVEGIMTTIQSSMSSGGPLSQ